MNNTRRKKIRACVSKLEYVREEEALEQIRDQLQAILEEEDDARDNIPESLQESDRYTASEEASEALEAAIECLDDAISFAENDEAEDAEHSIKGTVTILSDIA